MGKILFGVFLFIFSFLSVFSTNTEVENYMYLYPGEECFWEIYSQSDKIFIWTVQLQWDGYTKLMVEKPIYNTQVWDFINLETLPQEIDTKNYLLLFLDKNKNILNTQSYWTREFETLKQVEQEYRKYSLKIHKEKNNKILRILFPVLFIIFIIIWAITQHKKSFYLVWLSVAMWILIFYIPYWVKVENYSFIILLQFIFTSYILFFIQKFYRDKIPLNIYWIILSVYICLISFEIMFDFNTVSQDTIFIMYPYLNVIGGFALNLFLLVWYYQKHKKTQD